jgi:hypothetical protein
MVAKAQAPAVQPARLTDEQLAELMSLIRGADSVELKLTVPLADQRATIVSLGLDPVEAQLRQVWFFDTPDLELYAAGVVVRARRRTGGRGDTVVKLRPVVPEELPADIRRSASFGVEVDALPGGYVCSGSYKGVCKGDEVRDVAAGKLPLSSLYTKDQRAFYKAHAPQGIDLDSLLALGPTFVLKSKFDVEVAPRPVPPRLLVTELWLYQDGSRILEISTKCLPSQAFQVAMETRAYLLRQGINLTGAQQTKTKAAMEFFHAQIEAQRAVPAGAP